MSEWEKDKKWSDQFMPEVKRHCGEHLIGAAPIEEDRERNTDLIVLGMAAVRIGVRIRTKEYWYKQNGAYRNEFTIRSSRPKSGNKTELQKIREGWGDYFFYGFEGEDGALKAWTLCKLGHFRVMLSAHQTFNIPIGTTKNNSDGSSDFVAYKWAQFGPEFIIAQSMPADATLAA